MNRFAAIDLFSNFFAILLFLAIPAMGVLIWYDWDYVPLAITIAIVSIAILIVVFRSSRDAVWPKLIGIHPDLKQYHTVGETFPPYAFLDAHVALEKLIDERELVLHLDTSHEEPLSRILNDDWFEFGAGTIAKSAERAIDLGKQTYKPSDGVWSFVDQTIVRVAIRERGVTIEVAAPTTSDAADSLAWLKKSMAEHTVFRGLAVHLTSSGDQWGGLDAALIGGKPPQNDEIILAEGVRTALERNIIDYHSRRTRLAELGLPRKKGVIFYGPPGTGKTFTCRYLAGRLSDACVAFASGTTLSRITEVFDFARYAQPCVLVLEDVDLVFADREINPATQGLGTLMDELDGSAPDHSLIVILTTNALERVETAIKDRPGRISQCILFDQPSLELRVRYLSTALKRYDHNAVDITAVAKLSDGGSQAFLKELCARAVQIASLNDRDAAPRLTTQHFEDAHDEMTSAGGTHGRSILGFKT